MVGAAHNAARIKAMRDQVEQRWQAIEAADKREGEWEGAYLAGFGRDLDALATRLGERQVGAGDRATAANEADHDRAELLRARVEHAETLTTILAGLRGMKSRDAVQRAIVASHHARWTWRSAYRAAQTAGVQSERLTAANLNAGERLGVRRAQLEERIAELEERIANRAGEAGLTRAQRAAELNAWLRDRLASLGAYRARIEDRIAGRAQAIVV